MHFLIYACLRDFSDFSKCSLCSLFGLMTKISSAYVFSKLSSFSENFQCIFYRGASRNIFLYTINLLEFPFSILKLSFCILIFLTLLALN